MFGEVNLFDLGGAYVPSIWDDKGRAWGAGAGVDGKVIGGDAGAGIVNYSLKAGAEAYLLKGGADANFRLAGYQVKIGVEGCVACAGVGFSIGKEFSLTLDVLLGGGTLRVEFGKAPDQPL